jgi:hypothetical protein
MDTQTYKEIVIPTNNQQPTVKQEKYVEVDLETNKKTEIMKDVEQQENDVDFIEVNVDSDTQDETPPSQTQKPVNQQQTKSQVPNERKRPSRAQKRIRELNSKAHELESQLEQERREKHELMKKLNEGSKSSKETMKSTLLNQIQGLTSQMKKAMQDGDTDTVVAAQEQLIDAKTNLKVIELELAQVQEVEDYKPQPKTPTVSDAAQNWLEEHPEFFQDAQFHNAAKAVNASLYNEGYDIESEEFYQELSNRLGRRFPKYFTKSEKFVVPSEDVVEYSQEVDFIDPSYETSSDRDVKQTKAAVTKSHQQTVSGASRTPTGAASPNNRQNNNKVTLTPEDLEQMERWGMSMEKMARRKLHMEKNRRADGYVPITIKTS